MKKIIYLTLIFVITLACNPIKHLETAKTTLPDSYKFSVNDKTTTQSVDTPWWQNFNDTLLNNLIKEALYNNNNLEVAMSNIKIAQKNIKITRSEMLPNFDLQLSATANYSTTTKIRQNYVATPTMNWQFNLAGAGIHATEVAKYNSYSIEKQYSDMQLTLICDVISNYISIVEYKGALELSEDTYNTRLKAILLIDSMVYYGMSSSLDLEQAKSLLATAAASIPQYKRALEQSITNMGILLSDTNLTIERFKNSNIKNIVITPLNSGIPSDLLKNRSDIMASMFSLESARSSVKVAHAARFPSLSLTADGGVSSNLLKGIVNGNPTVWGAGLSLLQPLFSFGKNKKNEQIAVEKYNQALSEYEQNIIVAFQEVESALSGIETFNTQISETKNLVSANRATKLISSELYKAGLNNYIYQLDAERELFAVELSYIQLLSAQINNYVALHKAIGVL